jgi:hypothetical protein
MSVFFDFKGQIHHQQLLKKLSEQSVLVGQKLINRFNITLLIKIFRDFFFLCFLIKYFISLYLILLLVKTIQFCRINILFLHEENYG